MILRSGHRPASQAVSRHPEAASGQKDSMSGIQPPSIEEPEVERIPQRRDRGPARLAQGRRRAALLIAIIADVIQWIAFPLFTWGAASLVNDALDVVVALIMFRLVGFHWAFLPTFIVELMPFVDLVPSWTAAVWFATRPDRFAAVPGKDADARPPKRRP